jgi:hypothetical protein
MARRRWQKAWGRFGGGGGGACQSLGVARTASRMHASHHHPTSKPEPAAPLLCFTHPPMHPSPPHLHRAVPHDGAARRRHHVGHESEAARRQQHDVRVVLHAQQLHQQRDDLLHGHGGGEALLLADGQQLRQLGQRRQLRALVLRLAQAGDDALRVGGGAREGRGRGRIDAGRRGGQRISTIACSRTLMREPVWPPPIMSSRPAPSLRRSPWRALQGLGGGGRKRGEERRGVRPLHMWGPLHPLRRARPNTRAMRNFTHLLAPAKLRPNTSPGSCVDAARRWHG